QKTKIYALLGDPVSMSVGHILHNKSMLLLQENAVYVKLQVTPTHLPSVLTLCRALPFFGLSITMPLKETLVPYLDTIDPSSAAIQAINTVTRHQDTFIGYNTDGTGALDALAQHLVLEQQVIVILGSGGAARAIAYEALQRRAKVIILGRTLDKALALSETLECEGGALHTLGNLTYSVLINTLPLNAYTEEKVTQILKDRPLTSQVVAMDIVYQPILTPFLKHAQAMGCRCIFGYEMYIKQALLQIKLWFNPNTRQLNEINSLMNQYFLTQRTLS
ncbi:MAG: shikimate dehydrogenase, partial [Legionellaceae bacterium]